MAPVFIEHTKYHVVYRSNERSNASPYHFIGDFLGWSRYDDQEAMFSCRPDSGTLTINTRWYNFDQVEVVPADKPNRSVRKKTR